MSHKKNTILFVDDEANILSGLKRLLRPLRRSWNIEFAVGGKEALEVLKTTEVDVIVTDMRMPEIDGAQLLNEVAEKMPSVIRLVLSGQSQKQKLLSIVNAAHQFLAKPCDSEILIETIRNALNGEKDEYNLNHVIVAPIRSVASQKEQYMALRNVLEAANSSIHDVYDIVSGDVGLTVKIMQMVNSSFFGCGPTVTSLFAACERLGVELVRELFNDGEAFEPVLPSGNNLQLFAVVNQYSRRAAAIAKTIAAEEGCTEDEQAEAHLAGLIHDVGKLVLSQRWPANIFEVYGEGVDGSDHLKKEWLGFQTTHCEVGSSFLSLWGFPQVFTEVAEFHHEPEKSNVNKFGPLAAVYVANLFLSYQHDTPELLRRFQACKFLARIGCTERAEHWLHANQLVLQDAIA